MYEDVRTDEAGRFVNPEPSPEKLVAVSDPVTYELPFEWKPFFIINSFAISFPYPSYVNNVCFKALSLMSKMSL